MFFAPIVTLELVTGARRLRYFLVRGVYATLLLLFLWSSYEDTASSRSENSIQGTAAFSTAFFGTFALVQQLAILLLTPAMTAGSIAQERERRTIEYLLASGLSSGEIVMSKYVARTAHVALLLLAGLPVLGGAMLLGGISFLSLLAVFIVALASLMATAALSIAVSVWATRGRDAVVRTYVFLFGFLLLPMLLAILGQIVPTLSWVGMFGGVLTLGNPLLAINVILRGFNTSWLFVTGLVAGYLVFSIGVLGWATLSLRRVYRKSVGASPVKKQRGLLPTRWWRPALGDRPMLWKELFAESAAINLGLMGRVTLLLLFVAATVLPILAFFLDYWDGYVREVLLQYALYVGTLLECGALLAVAARTAGSITAEKSDSWLTLLSTTLTPSEIVLAKLAGSIYSVRWFAIPLSVVWLSVFIADPTLWYIIVPLIAALASVTLSVGALGMWFSLVSPTTIRALSATVCVTVFTGGGYMLCCVPLMMTGGPENKVEIVVTLAPCIPFLLGSPLVLGFEELERVWGIAWVLGVGAYFFAGIMLVSLTIGLFDRKVGRPRRWNAHLAREP